MRMPMLALFALVTSVLAAGSAQAIPATWNYAGTVVSVVNEPGFGFPVAVGVGDPFQLQLEVETSTLDTDLDPDKGNYFGAITSAIFRVAMTDIPLPVAATTIRTILATNTHTLTGSGAGGFPSWFATIGGGLILPGGPGIPTTSVDLSQASFANLVLNGDTSIDPRPKLTGRITSFSISRAIPEPSGALLFGLAFTLLAPRLARRARQH